MFDGCNLWHAEGVTGRGLRYAGIGRGTKAPSTGLVEVVTECFRVVETGVGNEVDALVRFLNQSYAVNEFNRVQFTEVQRIAGTCVTGCDIASPGLVALPNAVDGFSSGLASIAAAQV